MKKNTKINPHFISNFMNDIFKRNKSFKRLKNKIDNNKSGTKNKKKISLNYICLLLSTI